MKLEETPSKEGILKVPKVQLSQPHFLPRFLPLMSYDFLRASLILHQAPQGSVTFPNDP